MSALSRRVVGVAPPIIPIIADLIRRTPGTISLGQGVVSYPPPPQVAAAVREFGTQLDQHKYSVVYGIAELREVIAEKLRRENGIPVADEREITVSAGGNMAFVNVLLSIADPGDEVILLVPYYFNHEMAVTLASCTPRIVATDDQYQPRLEAIRAAITPHTRAVVTISPNNPSGAVYSEVQLREINTLCAQAGIFHIHDEAYEYFTYGGANHFSPGSISGAGDHTISLFSLSKAYGLASWRIGYLRAPVQLAESIAKVQDTVLICPPLISQHAALAALKVGADYCRTHVESLARVRQTVLEQLQRIPDLVTVPPAQGAFYFLLRVHRDGDPLELTRRLVIEHRVAVIPGSAFGLTRGCYLRVSYGALPADAVETAVHRLTAGLQAILA